jgi:transcriptional regulator with XRE-family HTH domain
MSALTETLREELQDREYREGYDEAFLDHRIAAQLRVIREQRGLTQKQLADAAGMKQSRISAMEDEDYGSWSVNTLRRLAYALGVRLKVEFVEWGDLLFDVEHSGRQNLQRRSFEEDPLFTAAPEVTSTTTAPRDFVFAVSVPTPRNAYEHAADRRRLQFTRNTAAISLIANASGGFANVG